MDPFGLLRQPMYRQCGGLFWPTMPITIDDLRRFAIARSLFPPTTLGRAIEKLGFVQADPIRAPARAQDQTLRHRVKGYRAGDLERRYASLDVAEDVFINYGFVPRSVQRLMHPRSMAAWNPARSKRAQALLNFVRERGTVHPREVDDHFAHGSVTNYWGGSSNATTHLLDGMHYRGLLRVARRDGGIRLYAMHEHAPGPADAVARRAQLDALVDIVARAYAPLTASSLAWLVGRLRYAVPHRKRELKNALQRAKERLARARVDGLDWYWIGDERWPKGELDDTVRLLAPFDPIVWDRRRFELFWGWPYRFEAYTPVAKRKLGYYALPLLWRGHAIGWANVSVKDAELQADFGYVAGRAPEGLAYARELEAELDRMRVFLRLAPRAARRAV
jgi:uncharacterized protein